MHRQGYRRKIVERKRIWHFAMSLPKWIVYWENHVAPSQLAHAYCAWNHDQSDHNNKINGIRTGVHTKLKWGHVTNV